MSRRLLNLNLCTSTLEGCLQSLCCSLVNTFLQFCRSSVNELFSLFQTKAARFLNCLHYLKLCSTGALQYNVERSLLLSSSTFTTSCRTCNSNSCSSRLDSVLILEDCLQFTNFFHCQIN